MRQDGLARPVYGATSGLAYDTQRCKKSANFLVHQALTSNNSAMAWNFVEGSMEKHGNGMEFCCYSGVRTLMMFMHLN